jgi:hypothetical protein
LAHSKDFIDGLRSAETIAVDELAAAEKELGYNLSSSVRERTEVRRNTAETILQKIRKAMT